MSRFIMVTILLILCSVPVKGVQADSLSAKIKKIFFIPQKPKPSSKFVIPDGAVCSPNALTNESCGAKK